MATSTIARLFPHRWVLEAMPFTKPSTFRDGDIDGELYSARYTRGNIRGRCKDCRRVKTFHPFSTPAGDLARRIGFSHGPSLTGAYAPVSEPMLSPSPVYTGIPEGEPVAATLA